MSPTERARAVVLSWQAARLGLLRGGVLVELEAAVAAAIEAAVAVERARCVTCARLAAGGRAGGSGDASRTACLICARSPGGRTPGRC